jgi:hypothetical protein
MLTFSHLLRLAPAQIGFRADLDSGRAWLVLKSDRERAPWRYEKAWRLSRGGNSEKEHSTELLTHVTVNAQRRPELEDAFEDHR